MLQNGIKIKKKSKSFKLWWQISYLLLAKQQTLNYYWHWLENIWNIIFSSSCLRFYCMTSRICTCHITTQIRELRQRARPVKMLCGTGIKTFQPLFVMFGSKWKWRGTVSFPFYDVVYGVWLKNTHELKSLKSALPFISNCLKWC